MALAIVVAVAALLAALFGVIALAERNTIPRGTTIAGVDVGGLTETEARRTLRKATTAHAQRPLRLRLGSNEAVTRGTEVRALPLLAPPLQEALSGGTVDLVLARIGLRDGPSLGLEYELGPVALARLANRLDRRFGKPADNAAVAAERSPVRVVEARPGTGIDRKALRRALLTLPLSLQLESISVRPDVTTGEAKATAERVERLLDRPRRVRSANVEAILTPSRLRSLVRTEPRRGALVVRLEPKGLGDLLRVRLGKLEFPPRDAVFLPSGSRVGIAPSKPGQALDVERIGNSLTNDLESTVHRAWFSLTQPSLTTAQAKQLGIRELVSEFTTYYTCCQPRVTNIKRAAELLDGTIVRPRTGFSLNEALGRRTEEKGFVSAPQIYGGRLENAVGGGISQIATTLFNAAFFAGVKLVAHRAHQFYISRYPMGREATVSWGGPELIFRNDWPAAVLMKLAASDSGITVRFYSSKLGRRVETTTGEPYSYVPPRTITVRNSALPPGTTTTVQSAGESGFTVQYTREVYKGPRRVRDERYTVRYDAQNAIVETGPPRRSAPPPERDVELPAQEPADVSGETTTSE